MCIRDSCFPALILYSDLRWCPQSAAVIYHFSYCCLIGANDPKKVQESNAKIPAQITLVTYYLPTLALSLSLIHIYIEKCGSNSETVWSHNGVGSGCFFSLLIKIKWKEELQMNEKQNLRLKRNVGLDYVHTFLSNMNMQSSIWVLYLAYCGLHLAQIGLLEGIYHATSIVCELSLIHI